MVTAPPVAEIAVAKTAAAKNPIARRRSLKAKGWPNQRSKSQATRTLSPALQNPLRTEVNKLLSLMRWAATVPTTTPTTTATPARRPAVTRTPAAIPAAGQNTATSEGIARKASPTCAAKKYTRATAKAAPSVATHALAMPVAGTKKVSKRWNVPLNPMPNAKVSQSDTAGRTIPGVDALVHQVFYVKVSILM